MNVLRKSLAATLCSYPMLANLVGQSTQADEPSPSTPVTSAQPTQQELQQLVAPIALYPDSLVAQILAASTYPAQIVEADRWLQAHPELKGDDLAKAVDQQPWDPSVKALAEFPSVLANMDKNLSWTSSLGDAYINHQDDVINAVQEMRQQAEKAGNLKSTKELQVKDDKEKIVIEPADPEVVYVPEYDPWAIYGFAVAPWPGWYWYPGLYWTSPGFAFGIGFDIGFFGGYGWGWHHWGSDWHRNTIVYNHNTYISRSSTFVNRNYYSNRSRMNSFHGSDGRSSGGNSFHGGGPESPHASEPRGGHDGDFGVSHGGGAPREGGHYGAFSGYHEGGVTRGYSSRGYSSMGGSHGGGGFGGGGFHGGGGGSHGGGGRR